MENELISKSQVRVLEFEGYPSQDYADGYCKAINDVLALVPISALSMNELKKLRDEIKSYQSEAFYPDDVMMRKRMVLDIIDKYIGE